MSKMRTELKKRLRRLGHSQADLARQTGVEYKRLNLWVCGLTGLREEEVALIDSVVKKWERRNDVPARR